MTVRVFIKCKTATVRSGRLVDEGNAVSVVSSPHVAGECVLFRDISALLLHTFLPGRCRRF